MEALDLLLLETSQDMLNVKAASLGMNRAFNETGKKSANHDFGTIEPMGTTLQDKPLKHSIFQLSI